MLIKDLDLLNVIYIVTWPNGYFGNAGQSWLSINLEIVAKYLHKEAKKVEIVTITELLNLDISTNDVVIYNSSEVAEIRNYIKDILFIVNKKCKIIPSYEALMAHENKGFQELIRKEKGLGNLAGVYRFDIDDFIFEKNKKYVYKSVDGAGSSQVWLVTSSRDIAKLRAKQVRTTFKRKAIKLQRSIKLEPHEYKYYSYRHKGFKQAVLQDFIDGLDCDYKVLVFGQKYFVLNRSVRKDDFRASGSGNFSFSTPPEELLDYASMIFNKLDEPYISLDIAISKSGVHLIEYQVLNFGPYTLQASPGYYTYNLSASSWGYVEEKSCLNSCYGEALKEYIHAKADIS
jgi:glutathione synthase/RimK-type ligase-like ATP-grasp enzyme